MFANFVSPPTCREAFSMGDMVCIPPLLGITYDFDKALPNLFHKCLIPPMENSEHMGVKLKREAARLGLRPTQVAEKFGVRAPSVYDWYEHGRIHKKHYPALVEMSGKPLEWWLDFPEEGHKVASPVAAYLVQDERHKELLELFDGLPTKDQDEQIKMMKEKKQHYDAVIKELMTRRAIG